MGTRQVLALGGAALGALAALNSALAAAPEPPRPPTPGQVERFNWSGHAIHYTVAGDGPPLVLIHGIDIAASSHEMRFIAEPLSRIFRVYAIDLLGFGLSDRPRIRYTADLYVRLIGDLLRQVTGPGAAIVAGGLSAAYSVVVAATGDQLVRALVLSAPVGLDGLPDMQSPARPLANALLGTPILGQSLYNALTTRMALRALLRERTYGNPELVTEGMVDTHHALARQPNARHAIQAYAGGELHLDCSEAFTALRQPSLLVFGAAGIGAMGAEKAAATVRRNPHAQVLHLERCGSLPHEEQAERFAVASATWLGAIVAG